MNILRLLDIYLRPLASIYLSIAWWQLHKNAASNIEQDMEIAPHKAAAVRPLTTHHENYQSYTAGKVRTNS